jgi:hypothetical protein
MNCKSSFKKGGVSDKVVGGLGLYTGRELVWILEIDFF